MHTHMKIYLERLEDRSAGDVILSPLHLDDGNTTHLLLTGHSARLQVHTARR